MPIKIIQGSYELEIEGEDSERIRKDFSELEKEANEFEIGVVEKGGKIISITPFYSSFVVKSIDMYGDFTGSDLVPYVNLLIRYKTSKN